MIKQVNQSPLFKGIDIRMIIQDGLYVSQVRTKFSERFRVAQDRIEEGRPVHDNLMLTREQVPIIIEALQMLTATKG